MTLFIVFLFWEIEINFLNILINWLEVLLIYHSFLTIYQAFLVPNVFNGELLVWPVNRVMDNGR